MKNEKKTFGSYLSVVFIPFSWNSLLIKILFVFVSFLQDVSFLFISMFIMVFLDLITGIWKSRKLNIEIKSRWIRRTIEKLGCYAIVIIAVYIIEVYILRLDGYYLNRAVTGLVLLTEFKSLTENMAVISGNSVFSKIYAKVENIFKGKEK